MFKYSDWWLFDQVVVGGGGGERGGILIYCKFGNIKYKKILILIQKHLKIFSESIL